MIRRPADPYKHKSKLGASAILIRAKADRIDTILDDLLQIAKTDIVQKQLMAAKTKALEIVDIIEADER